MKSLFVVSLSQTLFSLTHNLADLPFVATFDPFLVDNRQVNVDGESLCNHLNSEDKSDYWYV